METQNFASIHVVRVDCQLFAAIKFMFTFKLYNKGVAAGDGATRGSTGSAPFALLRSVAVQPVNQRSP